MMTAKELAVHLSARLEGDAETRVSGIASPESAGAEDLIYADAPKQLERAAHSRAHCVILSVHAEFPAGQTLLRVTDPKRAFARAAALLLPSPRIAEGVHATALIAPSARLGANVAVGAYAVIEDGAEIGAGSEIGAHCVVGRAARMGRDCRLYPRVTLYPGARLGDRVIVHAGAVIGSDGFGYIFADDHYEKFPQAGRLEIADDVEIGANVTVDRGSLDATTIGAGTKLDNMVHVAHNVSIGRHTVVAAQTGISGSSTVGDRVVIGGQVGVADHCTLEDGSIIGAQAGIPTGKTIRSGQTVWGTPARPLDKFKEQYAWFARLPDLAARVKRLEESLL